jgi:hypothetical protein
MHSIEIVNGASGRPVLVQRRHDAGGTSYEFVTAIEPGVAAALDDRGVCVWQNDSGLAHGRPAVVLSTGEDTHDGMVDVEIRADGADPTTVLARAEMPARDARICVAQGEAVDISWILKPGAAA